MANQIPIILSAGRQRQILNTDNLVVFGMVVATGAITEDRPTLNLTQTWNNAAVDFTGIKLNVTNSNSGPFSLLMDLQVGGISTFSVTTAGDITGETISVTSGSIPQLTNLTADGAIMTTLSNGTLEIEEKANAVFEFGLFYSTY